MGINNDTVGRQQSNLFVPAGESIQMASWNSVQL